MRVRRDELQVPRHLLQVRGAQAAAGAGGRGVIENKHWTDVESRKQVRASV